MKKIYVALLTGLILAFPLSAAEWEGSASVGGDLPGGYFAATNAFPRGTKIIITNLENDRNLSVEAVVAQGLDSPGLLAMLSRDAALEIAINPNSYGRVSIRQAESNSAQISGNVFTTGDPDHDPAASVAVNGGLDPALWEEMDKLLAAELAAQRQAELTARPGEPYEIIWDEPPAAALALEVPPNYVPPPAYVPPNYDGYDFYVVPAEPRIPVSPEPVIDQKDVLVPLDQYPRDYYPPNLYPNPADQYTREPYPTYPNPGDVIPNISAGSQAMQPEREYRIDPADIIPSINEGAPERRADVVPPGDQIIPSITNVLPVQAAVTVRNFSVPEITNLERGKYYIQVAAGPEAEGIESEIRKIGRSYPLAVQPTGNIERPVYRLLVGPVNLGESNALLERFKASYKDAFIRVGT